MIKLMASYIYQQHISKENEVFEQELSRHFEILAHKLPY